MSVTSARYEEPYRPRRALHDRGFVMYFEKNLYTAGGPPTDYEKTVQALARIPR